MKLTNVARASLEELLLDYEDFLRQRGLPIWDRNDPRRKALVDSRPSSADDVAIWARRARAGEFEGSGRSGPSGWSGQRGTPSNTSSRGDAESPSPGNAHSPKSTGSTTSTRSTYPEVTANGMIALINDATYLLDRQLAAQARAFTAEGGFTERLYRTRKSTRS